MKIKIKQLIETEIEVKSIDDIDFKEKMHDAIEKKYSKAIFSPTSYDPEIFITIIDENNNKYKWVTAKKRFTCTSD